MSPEKNNPGHPVVSPKTTQTARGTAQSTAPKPDSIAQSEKYDIKWNYQSYTYPADVTSTEKKHFIVFHIFESKASKYTLKNFNGGANSVDVTEADKKDKLSGTFNLTRDLEAAAQNISGVLSDHKSAEAASKPPDSKGWLSKAGGWISSASSTVWSGTKSMVGISADASDAAEQAITKMQSMAAPIAAMMGRRATSASIMLYMVPGISFAQNIVYNGVEFGMNSLMGSAFDLARDSQAGTKSITAEVGSRFFGSKIVTDFLGADSDSSKGLLLAQGGLAKNPHLEQLFQRVDNRKFTFDFNFIAKTPEECQMIKNICYAFRFESVPEMQGMGRSRFFVLPAQFEIEFGVAEGSGASTSSWLPKIGRCVCNSVDVSFNEAGSGGGWQTFKNGAPLHVKLSLNFTELDILTKERVEAGY